MFRRCAWKKSRSLALVVGSLMLTFEFWTLLGCVQNWRSRETKGHVLQPWLAQGIRVRSEVKQVINYLRTSSRYEGIITAPRPRVEGACKRQQIHAEVPETQGQNGSQTSPPQQ